MALIDWRSSFIMSVIWSTLVWRTWILKSVLAKHCSSSVLTSSWKSGRVALAVFFSMITKTRAQDLPGRKLATAETESDATQQLVGEDESCGHLVVAVKSWGQTFLISKRREADLRKESGFKKTFCIFVEFTSKVTVSFIVRRGFRYRRRRFRLRELMRGWDENVSTFWCGRSVNRWDGQVKLFHPWGFFLLLIITRFAKRSDPIRDGQTCFI